jgi:hypothetical protein
MPATNIKKDDALFLQDGEFAIGAVRQVLPEGKPGFVVYIENAGDFLIPFTALQDVHFEKVILDSAKLDPVLRAAIARVHAAEDPDNNTPHKPV